MIASICGDVLAEGPGWLIISVGGLGYRVEVPLGRVRSHIGAEVSLHTSLIVREDSMTLYGFESQNELDVFGLLLGVSGVGPRSALGVLTELSPLEIAQAVKAEDDKPFRRVSGVGPKTAKLISISLSGKLSPEAFLAPGGIANARVETVSSAAIVHQGLIGLGYVEAQAELVIREALEAGAPEDEAGLLRAALALLQAPRGRVRNGARS